MERRRPKVSGEPYSAGNPRPSDDENRKLPSARLGAVWVQTSRVSASETEARLNPPQPGKRSA